MKSEKLFLVVLLLSVYGSTAHAYIDPGAGSMLLQAAVGIVIGGLLFLKLAWGRFCLFFSKRNKK